MHNNVLLVVPCYNEAKRLTLSAFADAAGESLQFLFYDDGSTDQTASLIEHFVEDKPHLHFVKGEKNAGKAEAVRQGILRAKAMPAFETMDWIGFWDADLATPLNEVQNMLDYVASREQPVHAIFGSRVLRMGAHIKRLPHRHYLARVFATFISIGLKVKTYDSQCGAKLFRREIIDQVFSERFISRWIFDVEIVLRLNASNIVEYPLNHWVHVPKSRLRFMDMFMACSDLLRIGMRRK